MHHSEQLTLVAAHLFVLRSVAIVVLLCPNSGCFPSLFTEHGHGPLCVDLPAAVHPERWHGVGAHRRQWLLCPGCHLAARHHPGRSVAQDGPLQVGHNSQLQNTQLSSCDSIARGSRQYGHVEIDI